jgi:hypothetical protein
MKTVVHLYFMNTSINEPISVITLYDAKNNMIMPKKIKWQNREYLISKLAYHHKTRTGRNIIHIFHVTSGGIDFRLRLDTESLYWTLEEIYDRTSS